MLLWSIIKTNRFSSQPLRCNAMKKYLIPHLVYGDVVILHSSVFDADWKAIKTLDGEIEAVDVSGLLWQTLYLSFERNEFIMAVSNELLSPIARIEILEIAKGFLPVGSGAVQMSMFSPGNET